MEESAKTKFKTYSRLQRKLYNAPYWSPKRKLIPIRNVRFLPIRRQREHSASLKGEGKFGVIPNSLITSDLNKAEFAAMSVFLLLAPREHPDFNTLKSRTKLGGPSLRKALQSLISKKVLVRDLVRLDHVNEKEVFHITHPSVWAITGFRNSTYSTTEKSKIISPDAWTTRTFTIQTCPPRINEADQALKNHGDYVEVPRILSKIALSPIAKRIWLYIASLPDNLHPTIAQISQKLSISKPTVSVHLEKMLEKKMFVENRYYHSRFGASLERTFHTVNVALWDFPECAEAYAKPSASILFMPEQISYYAQNKKRTYTQSIKDSHKIKIESTENQIKDCAQTKEAFHEISETSSQQSFGQSKICLETSHSETFSERNLSSDDEKIKPKNIIRSTGAKKFVFNSEGKISIHIIRAVKDIEPVFTREAGTVDYALINDFLAKKVVEMNGNTEEAVKLAEDFSQFIVQNFGRFAWTKRALPTSRNSLNRLWTIFENRQLESSTTLEELPEPFPAETFDQNTSPPVESNCSAGEVEYLPEGVSVKDAIELMIQSRKIYKSQRNFLLGFDHTDSNAFSHLIRTNPHKWGELLNEALNKLDGSMNFRRAV